MKKIISIMTTAAVAAAAVSFPATAAGNSFTDMNGTEYFALAADTLSQLAILKGYEDGSFGAGRNISRAEMAAIICRMLNLDADAAASAGATAYMDVPDDHWATGYINVASDKGIIQGDGGGVFRPSDNVRYEEAVKMVVCAAGLDSGLTIDPADWSRAYLNAANKNGITKNLRGAKGKASTRGDVALMVYHGLTRELKAPVASVKEGTYSSTQNVTLTSPSSNVKIYYTTDGSDPSSQNGKLYTKAIPISQTTTIRAVAVADDLFESDELVANYVIRKGSSHHTSRSTKKYKLTVVSSRNGYVDTSVSGNYYSGSRIDVMAWPDDGYEFYGWESDNGGSFDSRKCAVTTFRMPARNVTITADFIPEGIDEAAILALFGSLITDDDDYDDYDDEFGAGMLDFEDYFKYDDDDTYNSDLLEELIEEAAGDDSETEAAEVPAEATTAPKEQEDDDEDDAVSATEQPKADSKSDIADDEEINKLLDELADDDDDEVSATAVPAPSAIPDPAPSATPEPDDDSNG